MRRNNPPRFILQFFRWFCHPELKSYIEGDLMELYDERINEFGKSKADRKFIVDVLLLFRPGIIRPSKGVHYRNDYSMFRNYFKVGVRNILKYKTFSFINIFGLAVAMSVSMLIILMLMDQNRYDQFHEKKNRIYRILSNYENSKQPYATSPYPLAAALKSEYPIVEETTNLTPGPAGDATYNQHMVEMRGYFADPAFFRVFSFKLENGDDETALTRPNSIVISRVIANKLFGSEDPVGKVIEFSDRQLSFPLRFDGVGAAAVNWGNFTVTGVIDESAYKSHLKFDVLMSSSSRQALINEKKIEDLNNNWEWYFRCYTYVLLNSGRNEDDLSKALGDLVAHKYKDIKAEHTKGFVLLPQALGDIQLGLSGNDTDNRMPGLGYYLLTVLATVIMLSACLNYTNLSVARALTRAKEIGVRKVTGANKRALVTQFLSESIITSLLAMIMAVVLLFTVIKPGFQSLWVNRYLEFELPASFSTYVVFVAFGVAIGTIAGFYPAFYLSSYQPIKALKNLGSVTSGKLGLRKVLSVSQFVFSLFFITTSILIFNQFKHYMEFDYGFDAKNIVNIELQGADYKKLMNELNSVTGISTISASDLIPATGRSNGNELKKTGSTDEYTSTNVLIADENFTNNLGLKIIGGKNLRPSGEASDRLIVVNEQFVKKLGYKFPAEAIGAVFESKWGNEQLEIVGVVENFRYNMLVNSDEIKPVMIRNQPSQFQYLNVRISSTDMTGTIAKLEQKWKKIDPLHPFKYEFYDDQIISTHKGIFDVVSILGFIAFLAILIACLGLLGMATFAAERRKKEVGIRKVLGAQELRIAFLLSKEFIQVLAMSICIGAPSSFIINNLWLQKLPNRVEFGAGTVLIGTFVLLMLGILTIGSQTLRASKANPVDSLKME
jgi:putative ABC transport system permease protein